MFNETLCFTVGPVTTWLELPVGGGGSIMRVPDSELGPPAWLAEKFAKAGLK